MIASKLRGITKCSVPAKAKKAASAFCERVIGPRSLSRGRVRRVRSSAKLSLTPWSWSPSPSPSLALRLRQQLRRGHGLDASPRRADCTPDKLDTHTKAS